MKFYNTVNNCLEKKRKAHGGLCISSVRRNLTQFPMGACRIKVKCLAGAKGDILRETENDLIGREERTNTPEVTFQACLTGAAVIPDISKGSA